MLQGFRGFIESIVGKALFFVLIGTFALLGVGYGVRDLVLGATQATDAATVGDRKVTLQELDRKFRQELSVYQRQFGAGFSPTAAQKQQIVQATLDQQVTDALYANAAADHGIRVDNDQVRERIQREPALAGDDKRFDPILLRMRLESQGISEATFTESVRSDLARQSLLAPILGRVFAPKALVEDLYRYRNEQRVAEIVALPNAAVTGISAPTDADIQAYYQKHAVEFTLPEYRSFTVLSLTPDLFMAEITPSDDDLRAAYESRKAEFVDPEKRKVDQVVAPDEATAVAIVAAVKGGKSLTDAAKAASAGKLQPVSLDFLTADQFPEALRQPVFAAAKSAVAGPTQSPLGWHVVQVQDIQPGHSVAFEDVKAKLAEDAKREAAADRLSGQVDKLGDKILGGTPMEEVATGLNATPVKLGPLDAKGNPPPGAAAPANQTQPDPAWLASAFDLKAQETSQFQEGPAGGYFAVRVDNVTPPALRPLADVRADVVAGWTAEQRATANAKRAEELALKARGGAPMSQIANEAKAKFETIAPIVRDPTAQTGEQAQPAALVDALFQLAKIGDITSVATPDGQIVAKLTEIRAADPKTAGANFEPFARQVGASLQGDELAEYRAALRQTYKVKINPQAVETVAGQ